MALKDAFNDPSTQQPSMSRISFGALVLFVMMLASYLAYMKVIEPLIDLIKTALFTTAGVYGGNTVARVLSPTPGGASPAVAAPAPDAPVAPDAPDAPETPGPAKKAS